MTKLNQTNAYMSVASNVRAQPGNGWAHIECGETEGYVDSFGDPLLVIRSTELIAESRLFVVGEENLEAIRDEINKVLRAHRAAKRARARKGKN